MPLRYCEGELRTSQGMGALVRFAISSTCTVRPSNSRNGQPQLRLTFLKDESESHCHHKLSQRIYIYVRLTQECMQRKQCRKKKNINE